MCQEILAALEDAEKNEEVKFIILSAEGKIFSVGGDLSEMKRAVDADDIESLVLIAELVNTISKKINNCQTGYYGGRWSGCWSSC